MASSAPRILFFRFSCRPRSQKTTSSARMARTPYLSPTKALSMISSFRRSRAYRALGDAEISVMVSTVVLPSDMRISCPESFR